MKTLAPLTQDGFKASIELLRFQREQNNDLIHAITSIVGTAPTFIKGGDITQAGGTTTITNGIICYNEKLYTFTGGVFVGTPATLKVLFEEATADGYPQPYFVGDPIPKNIYLSRTARVDATGILFLSAIGSIKPLDYISQKAILVDNKANINGYSEIVNPSSLTYNKCGAFGNVVVYNYEAGFVTLEVILLTTASISSADWLVRGLPKCRQSLNVKIYPIAFINGNSIIAPITGSKSIVIASDAIDNTKSQLSLFTGQTASTNNLLLISIMYNT